MLLSNLFSTLSNEIQGLLVGRMFTPSTLGLYNQAYRLEGTAATTASHIIDQVTYPVMASIQDDRPRLRAALKRFVKIPAFVCCPMMAFLIVAAKPIIVLLFSDKWIDCIPYFRILCTGGLAVCLQGSANNAIAAIGKSNVFFRWTIIKRSLTIVLSSLGILIAGMRGLLWFGVVGTWVVYVINGYLVSKHIGYSLFSQIIDIIPYVFLSIVVGLLAYLLPSLLSLNMYAIAVIQLFTIIILYLAFALVFRLDGLSFILNTIKTRIAK